MIRFGLLGGRLGPVAWQVFVGVGSGLLGAAVLLPLLSPGGELGWLAGPESVGLAFGGAALVAVGLRRKGRAPPLDPRVE